MCSRFTRFAKSKVSERDYEKQSDSFISSDYKNTLMKIIKK